MDFTLLVLAQSLKEDQPQGSVYERVYFIGGKEAPWKDVANWFAKAFFAAGVSKEDKARSVSVEEAGEGEIPMLMSRDMKFISPRAQELGFRGNDNSDQFKEFLSVRADIFPA